MSKYLVHIEVIGHTNLEIEADSEEEAIEKAQESDEITEIDCGELENIEALAIDACTDKEWEYVCKGNKLAF